MWFLDQIITWFGSARDLFYDAYLEVRGWIWPFHYLSTPLYSLYVAFYYLTLYFSYFNTWVDNTASKLADILSYSLIYSYFKPFFDAAINAWDWISNAWQNVTGIISNWWSSASQIVLVWVQDAKNLATTLFGQANSWLASLQSAWDSFKGKIPTIDAVISWWRNWTGSVLSVVNTWWKDRLLDVQGLINSAFKERESFWSGWQDWRAQVTTFFTDPVEFIWSRFTDWFLGPEE